jgi:hypothetical protein
MRFILGFLFYRELNYLQTRLVFKSLICIFSTDLLKMQIILKNSPKIYSVEIILFFLAEHKIAKNCKFAKNQPASCLFLRVWLKFKNKLGNHKISIILIATYSTLSSIIRHRHFIYLLSTTLP